MRAPFVAILCFILAVPLVGTACADPVSDRIYPAPRQPLSLEGSPEGTGLVSVTTRDGLTLNGLEVAARDGMPTLLVLHGNGSTATDTIRRFRSAIAVGYGVVAADYRGYSTNPGRPSEAGLAADADAFMALARNRAGQGPLWIVGHSLGGGVGLSLAQRDAPDAVITIGTFTRLRDMTSGLVRAIVPNAYRNQDAVGQLTVPYFLIHGTADDVVPVDHGYALHRLAGAAGRTGASFVIVGEGHDPDGETITRILEVIRAGGAERTMSPEGLPEEVKLIPFGQTKSLNP